MTKEKDLKLDRNLDSTCASARRRGVEFHRDLRHVTVDSLQPTLHAFNTVEMKFADGIDHNRCLRLSQQSMFAFVLCVGPSAISILLHYCGVGLGFLFFVCLLDCLLTCFLLLFS